MSQQPSAAQQEAYLNNLRNEVNQQLMQELVQRITDTCFKKCTGKRGDGLDSSERQCLSFCMDRYMDTMNGVNQALVSRQQGK